MPIIVEEQESEGGQQEYLWSNGTPSQLESPGKTDFGSAGAINPTDLSLRRMPRSPEDKPPLPKYRRVEINTLAVEEGSQALYSDLVHKKEQYSAESIITAQPIPGGSLAQEPESTISSLKEPNSVILIDDSSDENVVVASEPVDDNDLVDLSLQRMPRGPEDEPPLAKYRRTEVNPTKGKKMSPKPNAVGSQVQEPQLKISSLKEPNPNSVIVIDDSSDEDVPANHIKGDSEKHERSLAAKLQLQKSCDGYFFERLGFTTFDFVKDSFITKLQEKFLRQRQKSADKCSKLMQKIEKSHSERKAHDRAMLKRISEFQFAECPVYLVDSVEALMPLTKNHLTQYGRIVQGPPDEILAFKFNQPIRRSDILTLVGRNWLNDNVINYYMNLLTERSNQREGQLPSVYAMNTFFLQRLTVGGYASVSRWTSRNSIFAKDFILVPVHCDGEHWGMAIIHMRNKTIGYYDSIGKHNQPVLDALESYLQQESLDKRQLPFDTSGFKIENVSSVPRQTNDYDCGVFSCMIAEYITRGATINFSQKNIKYFRKRMVLEIINGKLWN